MGAHIEAKQILTLIQAIAEKHSGDLFIVWRDAGCSGVGYISLPKRKELAFEFSFTNSEYMINIVGEEKRLSRLKPYIEYGDQQELEALLGRIEEQIEMTMESN